MATFDPDRFNKPAKSLISGEELPPAAMRADGTMRPRGGYKRKPSDISVPEERLRAYSAFLAELRAQHDYWRKPAFSRPSTFSKAEVEALEIAIRAIEQAMLGMDRRD